MTQGVLIVAEEGGAAVAIRESLEGSGFRADVVFHHDAARLRLTQEPFVALIVVHAKGGEPPFGLIREARGRAAGMPIYAVIERPRTRDVVRTMRAGANDVFDDATGAGDIARSVVQNLRAPAPPRGAGTTAAVERPVIVGSSPALHAVLRTVDRVARTRNTTVLIQGESGTGKELVARTIHHDGDRRDRPFMAINCAALNENILEAEIFGYEKGAFTGASPGGKKGLFEAADGGTLFLDEIGEMAPGLQAKLLRVLQENTFKRVGGIADIRVDVRVIASTNRDLREEVRKGTFRSDLFFRLNVMPIRVPALRERPEDILGLGRHFLGRFAADMGRSVPDFSPEAAELLRTHPWPGNVRELRNVCEYAAIVCDGDSVEPRHLTISDGVEPPAADVLPLRDRSIRTMEYELIKMVLAETRFNISRAARTLGINRSTLYTKMRDLGMHREGVEDPRRVVAV